MLENGLVDVQNSYHLNQKIDQLPGYGAWSFTHVTVEGSDTKHELFLRNPIDCIKALFADPAFEDHLTFAPERHFADSKRKIRLYTDMKTGEFWWEIQVCHCSQPSRAWMNLHRAASLLDPRWSL